MSTPPFELYFPLFLLLVAYAVLNVMAGLASTGDRAERMRDLGFGVALLAGLYTAVLLVVSLVGYPNRIVDSVTITLVIVIFFALLLLIFFAIFELLPGLLRRSREP
jgi:cytochrome bd-type quinol oxidase subunit 2